MKLHIEHLERVFRKLQQHSLRVKENMCGFRTSQVEYLGHIISAQGVAVDPKKIECISNWAKPKTLMGLRGFLSLAGYYRKFVRNVGIIAKPLTNMLKIGSFEWIDESDAAFEALKLALVTTLVLALPDFSKEFVIECDASGIGVGAVLSQGGHLIAFLSKALAPKYQALSSMIKKC